MKKEGRNQESKITQGEESQESETRKEEESNQENEEEQNPKSFFLIPLFFRKIFIHTKFHLYDHRGVHNHIIGFIGRF